MGKGNRKIEALITSGVAMMVDDSYADAQLSKYLMALEARQNNVTLAELGIFSEKENSQSYITKADNGSNVAVIPLRGFMQLEDGLCTNGVRSVVSAIENANADSAVKAIVLSVNTGGGEALSGQAIQNAVSESIKPILVNGEFIASAGYLAATGADAIYLAGNMSEVGSIGVMTTINTKALAFYRENVQSIYATKSQNKNEENRDLLNGDMTKLVQRLDRIDTVFMDTVKAERELKGDVDETLSGRLFMAQDAINNGLIDGVATLQETINMAAKMPKRKKKKYTNMNFKEVLQGTKLGAILFGANEADATLENQVEQINAHAQKFEAMQTQMESLLSSVGALKTEQAQLTARIGELETANQTLVAELATAKTLHDALLSENAQLKAAISEKDGQLAESNLKLQTQKLGTKQGGILVPAKEATTILRF